MWLSSDDQLFIGFASNCDRLPIHALPENPAWKLIRQNKAPKNSYQNHVYILKYSSKFI